MKLSIAQTFFVTEKGYKIVKRFATLRFFMDPFWKGSLGKQ